MFVNFSTYKVKIKHKNYTNKKGVTFENTVAIRFYDSYKKEIFYRELGYIDSNQIYEYIKTGKNVVLDDCYVENFSLKEYRKLNNIEDKESVVVKNFSAEDAIFESQIETNFNNVLFDADNVNFKGAMFIKGMVNFANSHFGKMKNDFSYCSFYDGNVSFYNAVFGNDDTIFKNSIFKQGVKDFQFCNFGKGKVIFDNTDFGDGDVKFIDANFSKGDVSFKISRFGAGKVDFHYSKFGEGKLNFEKVDFGDGTVDFRMCEFGEGRGSFNKSVFGNGDVDFEGASLSKGKLSFKRTVFGKGKVNFENIEFANADLYFDHTIFNADLTSFNSSLVKTLSLKSCHLDNYFDLRVQYCHYLDLSDTIIRDIIDLQPYNNKVEIKEFNFAGIRLIGNIYINWKKNNVKNIIKNQNTDTETKAEQFLLLKENFNQIGQYDFEDSAYVEFKRFQEKVIFEKIHKSHFIKKLWQYPAYLFRVLVFDKAGLYATSPVRVLLSMLISYTVFSIIFVIVNIFNWGGFSSIDTKVNILKQIAESFYFSAITYLTVGYGDICPLGANRWIASLEGFVGVFLMAYFTVAFVRKILR